MKFHDRPSAREVLREKKEVQPGKETKLEKGDFLALIIACVSVFGPFIFAFVALFFVFIIAWGAFFG